MTYILQFFQNIKLTVTQWTIASLAVLVGGLVVALKLQGGELHRARLQLLSQQIDAKDATADGGAAVALAAYRRELKAFQDAGGVL